MTTSNASGKVAHAALVIASSCSAAAGGFDLCARRTHDETTAVAAKGAAAFLRSLFDATIAAAAARGVDARPRTRTCDRLRWEWLASTAAVVDGSPDRRLLSECASILAGVDLTGAVDLGGGIAARFRVASAEAFSLASAVTHRRHDATAFALT